MSVNMITNTQNISSKGPCVLELFTQFKASLQTKVLAGF